jgi:hypothetical protein
LKIVYNNLFKALWNYVYNPKDLLQFKK